MPDLAIGDEIGPLKVLEYNGNGGIVQDLAIHFTESLSELGHGLPLHLDIAHSVQGNETIRLDGHACLIKLRAQLERDVEGITRLDLVARVALLELWCCPRCRCGRSRFRT
jgi:hypothetical protein